MVKCRCKACFFWAWLTHSRKNQWLGPSGLQLNQNRLPSTEQRARACSTKERGMRATSSSSTPARVMPCIREALDSSLPPKRKNRFSRPRQRRVNRLWLTRYSTPKPKLFSCSSSRSVRLRFRALTVLPQRAKFSPVNRLMAQQTKLSPMQKVFPLRTAPSQITAWQSR